MKKKHWKRKAKKLDNALGEAYQAVGVIGHSFGIFDDVRFVRLLDLLADGETKDGTSILPFPIYRRPKVRANEKEIGAQDTEAK